MSQLPDNDANAATSTPSTTAPWSPAPTLPVVANEQMREHWTHHAGPGWDANHDVVTSVFRPVAAAIVAAAQPLDGLAVLDVGCGTGGLSQLVAEHGGRPVGVDISATMVDGARRRFPSLRFETADVQVADLAAFEADGFDRVVSEFGVMFFDDPTAAFANVLTATTPGGRLAFACWRSLEDNQMFSLGTSLLAARMPEPPPPPSPGQPGPGAFADRDHVARLLTDAGWADVEIVPIDVDLRFGRNGSDGVEERLAVILAGSVGVMATTQLRPLLGDDGWADLLAAVRDEVRTVMVEGAVQFPGRIWLVTATAR